MEPKKSVNFNGTESYLEYLWTNFLSSVEDAEKAQNLNTLTKAYNQITRNRPVTLVDSRSLSSIPSRISYYLLQSIFANVNTNISTIRPENIAINENREEVISPENDGTNYDKTCVKRNFLTQLKLKQPDEINDVKKLREFLLSGLGGKLMDAVQIVGVKNVTCTRELTSLFIHLFPIAPWEYNDDIENFDKEIIDIFTFDNLIESYDVNSIHSKTNKRLINTVAILSQNYLKQDINQRYTCAQFSSIVINLLIGLVHEEQTLIVTDENSVTIQCLLFAVENFFKLQNDTNIFDKINCKIIRRKLLILIHNCFYNLFMANSDFLDFIDLVDIYTKLLKTLENDLNENNLENEDIQIYHNDIIYGTSLLLFHILNKTYNFSKDYNELFNILLELFQLNNNLICRTITILSKTTTEMDNKIKIYIDILQNTICDIMKQENNNCMNNSKDKRLEIKLLKKYKLLTNNTTNIKKHFKYKDIKICAKFKCVIENFLFNIIIHLTIINQKIILKHLYKNMLCSCNCNLMTLKILLNISKNNEIQDNCLNFIRKYFIRLIIKFNITAKLENLNTNDFNTEFIHLYNEMLNGINDEKQQLCIGLKHTAKISKFLPLDLTEMLLTDVILPIFLKEKQIFVKTQDIIDDKMVDDGSKDVINYCLNVIATFLKNKKLVKLFFIEENINELSDLLLLPYHAKNVSLLITIGIINNKSLGLNTIEQQCLTKKLMNMLFNSSLLLTDLIIDLLLDYQQYNLKMKIKMNEYLFEHINYDNKKIINIIKKETSSVKCLLHLGNIYWNNIAHLTRLCKYFKWEFIKYFNETYNNNIMLDIIYNIISCFLITNANKENRKHLLSYNIPIINKHLNDSSYDFDLIDYNNIDNHIKKINISINYNYINLPDKLLCDKITFLFYKNNNTINCDFFNMINLNYLTKQLYQKETLLISHYDNYINNLIVDSNRLYNDYKNENIFNYLKTEDDELINENVRKLNQFIYIYDTKKLNINIILKVIKNRKELLKTMNTRSSQPVLDTKNSSLLNNVLINLTPTSANKMNHFLNNTIFRLFYANNDIKNINCSNNNNDNNNKLMNRNLFNKQQMQTLNTIESKKLLTNIFENLLILIMDIYDHNYSSEQIMSTALQELRELIFTHSNDYWNSIENGKAIIATLQSLLKVAETKGTRCLSNSCMIIHQKDDIKDINESSESKDSESEFLSPAPSFETDIFGSDIEFSDNDDNYETPDDAYDADAEVPKVKTDEHSWFRSDTDVITTSTHYRAQVGHEGICKIIIEVLIQLSNRCLENPIFWPALLTQLSARLSVIKNSLGESKFLLKGFRPVLESDDNRLKDLQKTILELVTDINSPEALTEYFGFFTAENPPVDILLPRFVFLAEQSKTDEPCASLEFPVNRDTYMTATCDRLLLEQFRHYQDFHKHYNINSIFTKAATVIPLNWLNFQPWTTSGFTVTSWIQIKSTHTENFTCKHMKNDTPSPKSNSKKPTTSKFLIDCNLEKMLHLLSIGNDNIVISIYLLKSGKTNKLCINVIKPNADINEKVFTGSIGLPAENDIDNIMKRSHHSVESFSNEVKIESHNFDKKRESIDESDIGSINGSPPSSSGILKSTTNALRKSLSSLFAKNIKTNEFYGVKKPIVCKEINLPNNSWMFISLSVSTTTKNEMKATISVNGLEKCQLLLNGLAVIDKEKIDNLTVLGIGHVNDSKASEENTNVNYQYNLSNVMLFKKSISDKHILNNLMSLGLDCVSINTAQIPKLNPLFTYKEMNSNKSKTKSYNESFKLLNDNLLAVYSAHIPDILTGYNQIVKPGQSERLGIISQSIDNNLIKYATFTNATILSGGISNLLFLFAIVVEKSSSILHQSSVLKLLLKTVYNSKELYTEFKRNDGFEIISGVIRHTKCIKSLELLRCFLDVAFDGPVTTMKSGNEELYIVPDASLHIKHPELIIYIIDKYNCCWIGENNKDSKILDALFSIILTVTERSIYQVKNMEILKHAGLISSLINFCKINFIDSMQSTFISKKASDALVNIVNILACSSPTASLLDEIFKLLLLLHRPSDSFVTHDRSKFYFLISSTVPNKRGINFLMSPSSIGHSMRFKPRKGYVSIRNFPLASKLRRSMSFDASHSEQNNLTEDGNNTNTVAKSSSFSRDDRKIVNLEEIVQFRESPKSSRSEIKNIVSESNESHFPQPQPSTSKAADSHIYANVSIVKPSSHSTSSRKSSSYLEPSDAVKLSKALLNTQIRRQHENRRKTRRISRRKLKTFSRTDSETDRDDNSFVFNSKYGTFGLNNFAIKAKREEKTETHGVTYIQEGFFNLLNVFILILPDIIAEEVLSHFVTVEVLLVMSSNHDVNVRAAILRLIAVITHRLPPSTITQFSKQKYWHHLGNQISLHPANFNLLEACVQWITGTKFSFENFPENELNVVHKQGLNALLALIPQTLHDKDLAITTFKFVDIFYHKSPDCAQYMIENALIPSLIRTVIKYFSFQSKIINCKIYDKLCDLLSSIAYKALITSGTINALWDLLNGITYIEITKSGIVMRGARQTQAIIINSLLKNCINTVTSPITLLSFKVKVSKISFPGCTLSQTEMKTRFDLIMDRCVQFVTNSAPIYSLTKYEIKLIETVIALVLNGQIKGANIVNWCFSPNRSIDLKVYAIKTVWKHCKTGNLGTFGCDTKLIKTFTKTFIQTCRESITKEDFDIVNDFCNSLGGPQVTTWNVSQALERLEITREASLKEQRPAIDRTIFKYESIIPACVDVAMKITRDVVELQNVERRLTINQMRSDDERRLYEKWSAIIKRLSDEGAPWHNPKYYPNSWQLDPTEGPGRIRIKTKRCFLGFAASFLHKDYREEPDSSSNMILSYLLSSLDRKPNISLTDQLLYSFNVRLLEVDKEIYGELIITESQIVLIPTDNILYEAIICDISNVTEIWPRKYQHIEIALEFFMDSGITYLFIMSSKEDYDALKKFFTDKIVQWFDPLKLSLILQQWKEGQLTNWDYLMALNQLAGRSYHDLMQYPVLPWVLCDYENPMLDIDNSECYRKFERPIAVQLKENEAHYIVNYNYLSNTIIGSSLTRLEPYHFGSHYSNSGTILHFLVRIPPFTNMFLNYQDNNFDIPDRTFHALLTTWRLASNDSPTDVKELIPEFFTFPEMFLNSEGFDFGVRQSGERVHHVALPLWCYDSPRLFTLIHRQAIESDIARRNIHRWIDLIFGYKQSGQPAIDAVNVFHPATYTGFTCSEDADAVERIAFYTMMKTYGQMPRQLLKEPHPAANMSENLLINDRPILSSVKGLRWGIYTGSPELSEPIMSNYYQQYDIVFGSVIALKNTNVVYGVPDKCNVMQGIEPDTMNLISWGETDNVIKIKPFFDNGLTFRPLLEVPRVDPVTACGTNYDSTQLWFGHQSGRLCVYQCASISINKYNKNRYIQNTTFSKLSYNSAFRKITMKKFDMDNNHHMGNNAQYFNNMKWNGPIILNCHHDAITNIKLSTEFKIVVTVDNKGLTAIWDLNKIQYIRSIGLPSGELAAPITNLILSPTLGDIVTIHSIGKHEDLNSFNHIFNSDESFEVTETNLDDFVKISMNHNGKSLIRLHTINGKYINHVAIEEKILTACYSYIKEGTGVNVIAAGLENGFVRLWSSWNLDYIRDIKVSALDIIDLSFSTYQHLIVLTKQSFIHVWESKGLKGNSPKLPQIVFSKRSSV